MTTDNDAAGLSSATNNVGFTSATTSPGNPAICQTAQTATVITSVAGRYGRGSVHN